MTSEQSQLHEAIKAKGRELASLIGRIEATSPAVARYVELAETGVEETIMWAGKALTA